jgi:hypothetical protein
VRISYWPMTPKKLQQTNRLDWVFKLLLLFTIETKTDAGTKKHACALVSVLEEYKGHRRPGIHWHKKHCGSKT